MEANALYPEYEGELGRLFGPAGYEMSVLLCEGPNGTLLVIGVPADDRQTWRSVVAGSSDIRSVEPMNLVGLALPFEDASIDTCLLASALEDLPPRYRDRIRQEARRVSVGAPVTLAIEGEPNPHVHTAG